MPLIIIVVGVVVLALIVAWIQDRHSVRRTEQLRQLAMEWGYEFAEEGDARLAERAGRFLLFLQGAEASARNLLRGSRPLPDGGSAQVEVFDYTFTKPLGRYVRTWTQTVVRLTDASLDLPTFSLIPEPAFDIMIGNIRDPSLTEQLAGTAGVRFADHPDFSRATHLQGPDRRAVRALFSDEVVAYFKTRTDVCVEASESNVLVYRYERQVPRDAVTDAIGEALSILEVLGSPSVDEAEQ